MLNIFKRLLFALSFNCSLFLLLVVGIQNSKNKNKINLIYTQTISLPVSFIIGSSFISGSMIGSLITLKFPKKT